MIFPATHRGKTMFDDNQTVRLPVALTLTSGKTLTGCLLLSRTQKLTDALNKPEPFIEFEAREDGPVSIAKSAIFSAALLEERKGRSGTEQLRKPPKFDPYKVLGLPRGAPEADIRPAYLEKAKRYHPDQFAAQPLPPEVVDYLEAMFAAVQQAYEALSGERDKTAA
jgi:hypothetical protein